MSPSDMFQSMGIQVVHVSQEATTFKCTVCKEYKSIEELADAVNTCKGCN